MNYGKLLYGFLTLRANMKKTKSKIQQIQQRKLRKLLVHAYQHSPYYHMRFKEAGITEKNINDVPICEFPTMNKADMLKHFDEIVTVPISQEQLRHFDEETSCNECAFLGSYHVVHSSGSTGKPAYFIYDNAAWEQMLLGIIRGALWDMSLFGIGKLLRSGLRIVYIAATDGRYGGAMAVGGGIDVLRGKQLFLDIKSPIEEWIKEVEDFQPNLIVGYPSAVKILGELVEKEKVSLTIFRVITCGEPLCANLRSYLETVFHSVVVNIYGASESLSLGVETKNTDGMILFDDLNYIEVVDGVMYLTSLYNYVQPLIRYRISDELKLLSNDKSSPFTKTELLLGRSEDLLWFEDEYGEKEFLHPLAIEGFCIEGLLAFQFFQTASDGFIMLAETKEESRKDAIREEMLMRMREILLEKKLNHVQFSVRFVDVILPDPKTGKKCLIAKEEPLFE